MHRKIGTAIVALVLFAGPSTVSFAQSSSIKAEGQTLPGRGLAVPVQHIIRVQLRTATSYQHRFTGWRSIVWGRFNFREFVVCSHRPRGTRCRIAELWRPLAREYG
jgi:hypothetical protein